MKLILLCMLLPSLALASSKRVQQSLSCQVIFSDQIAAGDIIADEKGAVGSLSPEQYLASFASMLRVHHTDPNTIMMLTQRMAFRLAAREEIREALEFLEPSFSDWLDKVPPLKVILAEVYIRGAGLTPKDRLDNILFTQMMLEEGTPDLLTRFSNFDFGIPMKPLSPEAFSRLDDGQRYFYLFHQLCTLASELIGKSSGLFINYMRGDAQRRNLNAYQNFGIYLNFLLDPTLAAAKLANIYSVYDKYDLRRLSFEGWGISPRP